ncbi:hypothetical protein CEUSTIGMA_g10983.t1 [Chlamydomonas eustigma]|uniref:Uncharacterized protein n=1 Tax=Chlamydomonas eustigma TaxID=1157962 RepID=A0A250XKG2_9CHLO|nr:hypothetical protein CEUSTIGMA_g10983.t1 [Chlamydomonas eustigma]|eukprot:GAX83558.1 hypothetical protein CEUSTIGMA_g10983.t1 [Chlamydomonas eustigma]
MPELDSRLQYLQEEGNSLAESGDYKEALQVFFKILQLNPKIASVHEAVSQLHSELDDDDAALQSAARAVSLAPEWPSARLTLAHASRNMGFLDQAAQQLITALVCVSQTYFL